MGSRIAILVHRRVAKLDFDLERYGTISGGLRELDICRQIAKPNVGYYLTIVVLIRGLSWFLSIPYIGQCKCFFIC